MIDLAKVRTILVEGLEAVDDLDGLELDETLAVESQTKNSTRTRNAHRSRALLRLSDSLDLAAALTRDEYWRARRTSGDTDQSSD